MLTLFVLETEHGFEIDLEFQCLESGIGIEDDVAKREQALCGQSDGAQGD